MKKRSIHGKLVPLILALVMVVGQLPEVTLTVTAADDTWDGSVAVSFGGGNGSSDSPFQIATGAQLAYMADRVNNDNANYGGKCYILTADIDLDNRQWIPIGNAGDWNGNSFKGSLDGDGHSISNLAIGTAGSPEAAYTNSGLFGYVYCGTITDTGVLNAAIYSSAGNAGGLAGTWNGTSGTSTPINNCYTTGSVTVGSVSDNTGYSAGGLVGISDYSAISNCFSICSVQGGENAWTGGLAGYSKSTCSIVSCYATGDVESSTGNYACAGGLIGFMEGTPEVANCYAAGDTSCGPSTYAGGLIGYRDGGTLTGCYYNSSATRVLAGSPTGTQGIGAGTDDTTAKSSEEMKDTSFVTLLNTGYSGVWSSDTGSVNQGYPVLTLPTAAADSVTEKFNTEADGGTSFSEGGLSFDITGSYLHIEENTDWGLDDNFYVDNSGVPMSAAGVAGSFASTDDFIVHSLYLTTLNDSSIIVQNNDILIRGKLDGGTVFTHTVPYNQINTSSSNNYFTYVDLDSYSSNVIDELEFEIEAFETYYVSYLMIDDFQFTPVTSTAPTVTTADISDYTVTAATMGGNVTSDGGGTVTERGVVYSSENSMPAIGGVDVTKDENGSGTGAFSESVSGLSSGTTYYVRAYATTGEGTFYGPVVSFTTPAVPNKTLISITPPDAITDVANGTEKTAEALGLPSSVTLITDGGNVSGNVAWAMETSSYEPSDTDEQTFTVDGTVTLPGDVINTEGISLNVTISVTVLAYSTVFTWEYATDHGATVTETVDGITVTVSSDSYEVNLITDAAGYGGSSANIVGGSSTGISTMTFSFSEAVDILSIYAVEGGNVTTNWTYTPTGGFNSPVTYLMSANTGRRVDLHWSRVTSFTVSPANYMTGLNFDSLVLYPLNNAPTDITLSAATIAENAASGTVIGTFSTTDADTGDTHTYSLVSGTGDTDNASFSISGNELRSKAVFDHETKSSYRIRVKTMDGAGDSYEEEFTISVTDADETPEVITNNTLTIDEDASATAIVSSLLNTTVDAGETPIYTLTAEPTKGTLKRDSVVLSVNDTFTQSDIDTNKVTYMPTADVNGADSFTFSVSDGTTFVAGQTFSITITAVNDTPTVSGLLANVTVTEDMLSNVDLSAAAFSDADGDTLTVTLAASAGTFTAGSGGSITVGGRDTGTLTIAGTAANINTYLDTASNIQYTGIANANGDGAATFTVHANDGTVNLLLGTVYINITAVNDDPAITGLPSDITVTENTASNVDLSAVILTDTDSGANNITLTLSVDSGTLTAASRGGVTISGSGTASLTLSGTAADIDTYINNASNIRYTGASGTYGNDAASLTLTGNDGGNTGAGGGTDVTLGSVNIDITEAAPTVTNISSAKTDGTYGIGEIIDITVTFSHEVTVTGTPQLELETGMVDMTANYSDGSGTNMLTFTYTTQSGDESADLDYKTANSLTLSGGTIKRGETNAVLTLPAPGGAGSLKANKDIVIDTIAPTAPSVTSAAATTNDTTPTWTWTAGAGGNGLFRYKLDGGDLTSGATETSATSFTPGSPLSEGVHTLYVQERDAAGNWSVSGGYAVTVETSSVPTVTSVTVSPSAATVHKGSTQAFTATVNGTNDPANTVTWSVYGNSSVSTDIDFSGVLTVAVDETASNLTVTATSTEDTSKSGTAAVTVTAVPATVTSVTVTPPEVTVWRGNTQIFTAIVNGTNGPAQTVAWSVYGNTSVSTGINSSGLLTVAGNETALTLTVTATSTLDNSKYGTATVTVTAASSSDDDRDDESRTPSAPTTPNYKADVEGDKNIGTTIPVTIHKNSGTAFVDIGSQSYTPGGTVVTIPSIPDIGTYSVGIPVPALSTIDGQGSLTINTGMGSITVTSNMLTGIEGTYGSKAQITIGAGDKDNLPDEVKAVIGDKPLIRITLSIDGKLTDWNNPNAPVTVRILYTPTGSELLNPESIVIWYIDGKGNLITIPNGHYNPATGTVTFSTTHFSDYAVAFNKVVFSDVADTAWYSDAVSFIAAREITTGTGNDKYSPDAKLTRVEFIVLMMKAYGIAPDTTPTDNFTDSGNTYYTGYLAAAKRLGITAGVGNNMYAPDKQITRQEMFALLYNALKVMGQLPQGDSGKTLSYFPDASQIGEWAREAMETFVVRGAARGSNGKLTPTGMVTRAEMAQVLYSLMGK